jgi:hypothetical protein
VVSVNQLVGQQRDALDANASWPAKVRTNCARANVDACRPRLCGNGVGAAGIKSLQHQTSISSAPSCVGEDALRAGHVVSQLLGLARQSGRSGAAKQTGDLVFFCHRWWLRITQASGQVGVTLSLSG